MIIFERTRRSKFDNNLQHYNGFEGECLVRVGNVLIKLKQVNVYCLVILL